MDEPGPRAALVALVTGRIEWLLQNSEIGPEHVANLIVDDIFSSGPMLAIINRSTTNGMDAGFEKGLRDSIAAVGEVPRCDYVLNERGEAQLVMYQHAQRAIAGLSKRGLAELWADGTGMLPAPPGGSSPSTSSTA